MARVLNTLTDTLSLAADWLSLELRALKKVKTKASGKSRTLALFAWALPPASNAGVYRPLSFLRYADSNGWRADAFQGEAPANQSEHGDELAKRMPTTTRRHVIGQESRIPSYSWFPRIDGGFHNAIRFARTGIRELAADPPDVVLASGPPFFVFVAAFFVARAFAVPLVLDYRDEWTECPFDFVDKSGHDRYWERRCLKYASAVLFTTESHLRHQCAVFPDIDAGKMHLIPNGWEPEDFDALPHSAQVREGPMRLAHIGNLAGHTPPHEFLGALERLLTEDIDLRNRLSVQLIGRRSPDADAAIRRFRYPENLVVVDHVGKREATRRMAQSDALLLLANQDLRRYLPGKLFDYVASGRPVLVFGSDGESWKVLSNLGVGVLCESQSSGGLRESLARLEGFANGTANERVRTWLEEHQRTRLAARAFAVIESTLAA